ncbi:MAG: hypothetical protein HIU84_13930 [Acidobacteria bacterium]|nr:hypothetical protein [Acidobacteriota bacterium]
MMAFRGRHELLNAFELLDDELGRMGVEADLFIVGGAAMAVAHDRHRASADVALVASKGDRSPKMPLLPEGVGTPSSRRTRVITVSPSAHGDRRG